MARKPFIIMLSENFVAIIAFSRKLDIVYDG
jgi:hypothetical protein